MLPLSTLSIRTKLVAVYSVLIGGIALFIVVYFPTKLADREMEALVDKAHSIATMTTYSVSPALVFDDHAAAEEALRSASQNKEVIYVVILDDSGNVFASINKERADQASYLRVPTQTPSDARIYKTMMPIEHAQRPIGILYLGVSLEEMRNEVVRTRAAIGVVSLIIFLVGVAAVISISTVITKPLMHMVKTFEGITSGDWKRRAAVSSDDEVGHLAKSFNLMVDHLESAQRALADINRTLEERVEKRTRELQLEISERAKVEEALRTSARRQELVLRSLPMAFYTVRPTDDLATTWISEQVKAISGFSPQEFINDTTFWSGRIHPDDSEHVLQVYSSVLDKGSMTVEYRWLCADGSFHWFLDQTVLLRDEQGAPKEIIGTWLDITEQKRAEAQIREQAALLDVTRDAIIVQDLNDHVVFWNHAAERLYGWTADEASKNGALDLMSGQNSSQLRTAAREKVLAEGEWTGEMHHMTKDGRNVVVDSRWTLVRDSSGKPASILIVNTDISEKKQLESQFHRSQRLELIGTLAGGIAHDLNNVLAPILMAIQLLQSKLTDERSQQWLTTIESSAKRGADIVKQVLTFARGIEGERVVIQPKHLLREIEKIASETFSRAIQVRSEIPKDLWTVSGDATQLHQVLMNLSVNARDAMPNGGTLRLKAENLLLDEQSARMHIDAQPGPYVVISVIDTGVGIPKDIIEKIFDPFFTTKEVGKGTGLGLSTVQAIVKSHCGFVTVYTEVGHGTQFRVYLPASDTALAGKTAEGRDTTAPIGHGEVILVVDDEASVREITRETLESFGYRVVLARDGAEALSLFESSQGKIDVVLTDMMMPVMDGARAIRAIRQLDPHVKIIAASGLADVENMTELTNTSIQAFLPKPFKAEKLLGVLETVLRRNGDG